MPLSLDSFSISCHFPAMPLDIKICGLKTGAALAAALSGGATHVGFIFFPKSPRNISTAMMRAWGNRSDTAVIDEPFYAFYLKASNKKHPHAAAQTGGQNYQMKDRRTRCAHRP